MNVTLYDLPTEDANAALIAAAPDLLAALRHIARLGTDGEVCRQVQNAMAGIARDAIARAEGTP